jgi:acyl carrier protein
MSIKETIRATFSRVFSEQVEGYQLPIINDDLVLLESGLDSMGFAVLVVALIDLVIKSDVLRH